jgi:hypothetical protein
MLKTSETFVRHWQNRGKPEGAPGAGSGLWAQASFGDVTGTGTGPQSQNHPLILFIGARPSIPVGVGNYLQEQLSSPRVVSCSAHMSGRHDTCQGGRVPTPGPRVPRPCARNLPERDRAVVLDMAQSWLRLAEEQEAAVIQPPPVAEQPQPAAQQQQQVQPKDDNKRE